MRTLHRTMLLLLLTACDGETPYRPPGYGLDATAGPDGCAMQTWYTDCDGDGASGFGATMDACEKPAPSACGGSWTTAAPTDCNDTRADVHPGATEPCDGVDNDCDNAADEDGLTMFFADADSDGHGNPSSPLMTCNPPSGYVANSTDCNDLRADVHPGAAEVCDGADNDCNATIDDGVTTTFYRDADGDGFGDATTTTAACAAPSGYVANSTDCNDTNGAIRPGAAEVCDLVDNNCNASIDEGVKTTFYRDADSDGFGNQTVTTQACTAPAGFTLDSTDCNDATNAVHPNAVEACWNGVDDNCSGVQDDAAECQIQCNWSGARWLSHGFDGGNAFTAGAWVSCAAGQLQYIDSVFPNPPGTGPVSPPPVATGTGDTLVGCNWGNSTRWGSQGYDGSAAFSNGADLVCNGSRVTQMSWDSNLVAPGQSPQFTAGQLGCDWNGAIYLSHGIDGNCAWFTGLHVTCNAGHITDMRATEATGCPRQR